MSNGTVLGQALQLYPEPLQTLLPDKEIPLLEGALRTFPFLFSVLPCGNSLAKALLQLGNGSETRP